ncbi:hypothetical protein [Streptomyces wuyuanensis]|uniref:hypothetical protein n=1 Tax=Streptomyces wuyuanensis TaxID=1196353 RepID=UPI00372247CD
MPSIVWVERWRDDTADVGGRAGHARYTYRLRVSSTARTGLEAEWARCRWVWNACVAMSGKVHAANQRADFIETGASPEARPMDGAAKTDSASRVGA